MKNIRILSREDIKKLVKKEVKKKAYQQDRLINMIHRKLVDLEQVLARIRK